MTPDALQALLDERDLLRDDVRSLTEEIKLLVRAEHGLTRARADSERQLQRTRGLTRLAIRIAGLEQVDRILAEALATIEAAFEVDRAVTLVVDDAAVQCDGAPLAASPVDHLCLTSLLGARVAPADDRDAAALARVLASGGSPLLTGTPTVLLWVVLRSATHGPAYILCAWSTRGASFHRDLPRPEHTPFLELLANLVSRALDTAELTARLRSTGAELAESNRQLQATVTDLERTQVQLVQAQKLEALGRLSGGIAHDFNNLLTVILTHVQMVLPTLDERSEAADDLRVVLEATRRAGDITRRLLAFGRKQEHHREEVDINALVTDLSRMLTRLIGDDVQLQLDLDPAVTRLGVDPVQVEQILMNLVVNARDAMPQGGRLVLETRWARAADVRDARLDVTNMVAVSVIDSGAGMDDATRRQLFEPFFTTKPVGKGTGLGLATVYGLVNQNGGHISVESEAGKGSRFTVLLPIADVERSSSSSAPVHSRGLVLVVEDEDAIRRMVSRLLKGAGFDVVEARNGQEALEAMPQPEQLDLVLTDVVMPQMGGPELVRHLRKQAPWLKVLFVSGHTFHHLDDIGEEQLLAKPFTPEQLVMQVEAMFPSRPTPIPTAAG